MVIVNLLWAIEFSKLYYSYHYTDVLYVYMYPDWILFLNIAIGLAGMWMGTLLILRKIELRKALIIDITLLFVGFCIAYVVPMF